MPPLHFCFTKFTLVYRISVSLNQGFVVEVCLVGQWRFWLCHRCSGMVIGKCFGCLCGTVRAYVCVLAFVSVEMGVRTACFWVTV